MMFIAPLILFFLTGLISVLKRQLNWITTGWSLMMFVTIFWWIPRFPFLVSCPGFSLFSWLILDNIFVGFSFFLVLGVNEESKCLAVIRFVTNPTSRSCFHWWTSVWSHRSFKGCLWCGCADSWSSPRWL